MLSWEAGIVLVVRPTCRRAPFFLSKGPCSTSVVKVCVGTRCVNLQKHWYETDSAKTAGGANPEVTTFCSIADVVPPLAGLRSGSRPAGTFIVLVDEVCIAFFSRVFSLFLALRSSTLVLPGGSFRDAVPYETGLSCRASTLSYFSFVRAQHSFFSSIFPFQECVKIRRKQSFRAFAFLPFSFEEKTCVSRSVRLSFKLVIRARS